MDTITNIVRINSVEEFITAATEAKKNNIQALWDIPQDVLREIMLGDALDKVYGDPA